LGQEIARRALPAPDGQQSIDMAQGRRMRIIGYRLDSHGGAGPPLAKV
jgi:hypothetical protein